MSASPSARTPVLLHIGAPVSPRAPGWYLHRERGRPGRRALVADRRQHPRRHARDDGRTRRAARSLHARNRHAARRARVRDDPRDHARAAVVDRPRRADRRRRRSGLPDRVVTVTEGGYYLDEHNRLDLANADLAADLQGARTTLRRARGAARRTREARRARSRCRAATTCATTARALRGDARIPRAARRPTCSHGSIRTSRHRARWSTASRRARPPTCASACWRLPASTTHAR